MSWLTRLSLPPVLLDPLLARANYEALEKEVEARYKAETSSTGTTSEGASTAST